MKLVDLKIGPEATAKIELSSGVFSIQLDEETAGLQGGLKLNIPLNYFLDALAEKANNQVVSSVVKVVESVIATLP